MAEIRIHTPQGIKIVPLSAYTSLGRAEGCTVRLEDRKLSRKHCEIWQHGNDYLLVDLHSQNGTRHNGESVREALLADQDRLAIGNLTFTFHHSLPESSAVGGHVEETSDTSLPPLKPLVVKKIRPEDLQKE